MSSRSLAARDARVNTLLRQLHADDALRARFLDALGISALQREVADLRARLAQLEGER